MKKRSLVVASCIVILMMTNFVSAGIFISGLQSNYNYGDFMNVIFNVNPIIEARLLRTDLYCNDNLVIQFNNLPDEEGNVNIQLPLNFFTLNKLYGNCNFISNIAGESRQSIDFEISKKLIVRLSSEAFFVNPGEEIIISGSAERLNGNPAEGELDITIPLLSLLEIPSEETGDVVDEEVVEGEEGVNGETNEEESTEGEETSEEETSEETEETFEEETTEEVVEGEEEVEDIIDYTAGTYHGQVIGGEFAVSIILPENTPAGDFRIDVLVYESSDGQRSSEGIVFANLKVFQVLKGIDIALNNQNFDPGTTLAINPTLLDQTGVNIHDEISVVVRDELGGDEPSEIFFAKIVSSQETLNFPIPSNFSSGYYEIEALSGDLSEVKSFFVNEKARASFELINDTLIITNIGNIFYNKGVEVELGGKTFIKVVELDLGESAKFKLTGPDEDYSVKVTDGQSEILQGGVVLTGRSINVDAINEGGFGFSNPIGWIFVVIILGIGVLFLFRNIFKKKSFAFHFKGKDKKGLIDKDKEKDVVKIREGESEKKGMDMKNIKGAIIPSQANQVLVLKGHKSNAAILVLKIKNKIGKHEKQSLEKAIEHVYDKKGAVYEQGDFIFIVFSPLMTKTTKNEVEAAKVAQKIINVLREHNKKFKNKIDFGIGINSGEIINKIEDKKLKFTALGNFVVVAKRLASSSDRQVLVTKTSYEKGISEIKAEKIKLNEGEVYEVRRVVDSENNKKFIKGFLERQKKQEE